MSFSSEVKRGKHLAFKIPNGKQFVRCDFLGDDYTEAVIMERISGKRIVTPKATATTPTKPNIPVAAVLPCCWMTNRS